MICHKKCTQRCQEQTVCNKYVPYCQAFRCLWYCYYFSIYSGTSSFSCRDGFLLKNKPPAAVAQTTANKKATEKELGVPGGKENVSTAQQKPSFLSKFRKESPRLPLRESAKGTPSVLFFFLLNILFAVFVLCNILHIFCVHFTTTKELLYLMTVGMFFGRG